MLAHSIKKGSTKYAEEEPMEVDRQEVVVAIPAEKTSLSSKPLRNRVEQLSEALESLQQQQSKRTLKLLKRYGQAPVAKRKNDVEECWRKLTSLLLATTAAKLVDADETGSGITETVVKELARLLLHEHQIASSTQLLWDQLLDTLFGDPPATTTTVEPASSTSCIFKGKETEIARGPQKGISSTAPPSLALLLPTLPLIHLAFKLGLSTNANALAQMEASLEPLLAWHSSARQDHNVGGNARAYAVQLLIEVIRQRNAPPQWDKRAMQISVESRLIELVEDWDPRVRATALCSLAEELEAREGISRTGGGGGPKWNKSKGGRVAVLGQYKKLSKLCTDSNARVRTAALHVIVLLASRNPNETVKTVAKQQIRMEDDAFATVCRAVNDLSNAVRLEAVRLLGEFGEGTVSEMFLLQTLDKKLTREMRADKGAKGLHRWGTGKTMGEDVDAERDDELDQSLIHPDACGAFITALEDESEAIRNAAVHSLGRLVKGSNRVEFARTAIDHLSDMFNDEISEVRLDAIKALAPLMVNGRLEEHQLNTILSMLDDATAENRLAIHELISQSELENTDCIRTCYKSLLRSLKRFPHDKHSINSCMAAIGQRHPTFVQALAEELLDIHPIFHTVEQRIDDEYYLGRLVLYLNAASKQPELCSLIPAYVQRHYRYLRCACPHLIPPIALLDSRAADNSKGLWQKPALIGGRVDSIQLLEKLYEKITQPPESDTRQRAILLDLVISDLDALKDLDDSEQEEEGEQEGFATAVGLLRHFCTMIRLHDTAIARASDELRRATDDFSPVFATVAQCLDKLRWIRGQYSHVPTEVLGFMEECSLRLSILLGTLRFAIDSALYDELFRDLKAEILIPSTLQRLHERQVSPTPPTMGLISWISANVVAGKAVEEIADLAAGLVAELSKALALVSMPKRFVNLARVTMKAVAVDEPSPESASQVHRFVAGLPKAITLSCLLYGLTEEDLPRFRVRVEYPDNQVAYFNPLARDFHVLRPAMATTSTSKIDALAKRQDRSEAQRKRKGGEKASSGAVYRLSTKVMLSSMGWLEPIEVYLTCGLLNEAESSSAFSSSGNPQLLSICGVVDHDEEIVRGAKAGKGLGPNRHFLPLPNADARNHVKRVTVKIHPMAKV